MIRQKLKIHFIIRNSYKLALAESLDTGNGVLDTIARNPENANNLLNTNELFKVVDGVSAADLNAVSVFSFYFQMNDFIKCLYLESLRVN